MSEPRELAQRISGRIVDRFGLLECPGTGGGPHLRLESPSGHAGVGELRLWRGSPLQQLVYVGLDVDEIDLDSHSVLAFCPPVSAVPHFRLDAVCAAGTYAYHLDLVPRVDLAAHLQYVRFCYDLLTEATLEANRRPGLDPIGLAPLQYAMMSPWMLAHLATVDAFGAVGETVDEYLQHWYSLVEDGLPAHVLDEIDPDWLPERDRRMRRAMFDPVVDPTWAQVARLVGAETAARIRDLLTGDRGQPPRE